MCFMGSIYNNPISFNSNVNNTINYSKNYVANSNLTSGYSLGSLGVNSDDYSNSLTSFAKSAYADTMSSFNLKGVSAGYQAPGQMMATMNGALAEARGIAAKKAANPDWKGDKTEKTLREEKQIEVMELLSKTLTALGEKLETFAAKFDSTINKLDNSFNNLDNSFSNLEGTFQNLDQSFNSLEDTIKADQEAKLAAEQEQTTIVTA